MNEPELCKTCREIKTTRRDKKDNAQCANCANNEYFDLLSKGVIRELKVDMRYVKQSTWLQILALIESDKEAVQA